MNRWLELLLAVVLISAPILVGMMLSLGEAIKNFIIGAVAIVVFISGIIFLILAVSDFK